MIGTQTKLAGKKVWVAGHRGMVGAALSRRLREEDCEVLTVSRSEVDLRDSDATTKWVQRHKPDLVFCAAAKVGGIHANNEMPADFLCDNLRIQLNVIDASHRAGVEKLVFLGSSCIYPRLAEQPIQESALMTGPLEPTNQWYAVAKIAGILQCQAYRQQHGSNFISAMPTNLYGPGDNYHPLNSHVVAALIRKAHEAKIRGEDRMVLWGSGKPKREFLFVDDCADALVFLMKHYDQANPVNIGVGEDMTIAELARTIASVVGFGGRFEHDLTKPDGTPRKLLDVSRLRTLGWQAATPLKTGLEIAYRDFCDRIPAEAEAYGIR
ncbi:MAG: GDP-L-fucose synthase [Alphaproteobacteria bacterium]|nr:GDP-L-fucose synthase [Alphaproteobacteria bacterium]MBO6861982.1 GDP-L-fucose synthase [Alphaproteobacteria bacterium]